MVFSEQDQAASSSRISDAAAAFLYFALRKGRAFDLLTPLVHQTETVNGQ
jgi:hypothetical protein